MVDSNTPPRRSRATTSVIEGASAPRRVRKRVDAARSDSTTTISAADRMRMIETAAYYRAEHRGFIAGHEADDWLSAEAEIDALIAAARSPASGAATKRSGSRKPRAN
jgi:hypothetical protein